MLHNLTFRSPLRVLLVILSVLGSTSCVLMPRKDTLPAVRIDATASLLRITRDTGVVDLDRFLPFNVENQEPCPVVTTAPVTIDRSILMDRKSVVSTDGRFVLFRSIDSNLLGDDSNNVIDIFVSNAVTGATTRVSLGRDGTQANGMSVHHGISGDGRFVAFSSEASNLVDQDANGCSDIFLRDLRTGRTELITRGVDGSAANGPSWYPPISDDARYVAFASDATNLVEGDHNQVGDIFLHDRTLGRTMRVTMGHDGTEANGQSTYPSISASGKFIVFTSSASNLVPGDRNGVDDVFRYDRDTREITRVSVCNDGRESDGPSYNYTNAVTTDGGSVVFVSRASNLGAGDDNAAFDVFLRDLRSSETLRISETAEHRSGNGQSLHATISALNGRYIAFHSDASNLVAGDTNAADDIFVYDRSTASLRRISVGASGLQANAGSYRSSLSGTGSTLTFSSDASNLAPGDANGRTDVFVVLTQSRNR